MRSPKRTKSPSRMTMKMKISGAAEQTRLFCVGRASALRSGGACACRVLRVFVFVFRVAPILWEHDAHAVDQRRLRFWC